jgi:acyl carrier protein
LHQVAGQGTGRNTEVAVTALEMDIRAKIFSPLHMGDAELDDIARETLLFDNGLGLDSVDALEVVIAVEREFGVTISKEHRTQALVSFGSLADYIRKNMRDGRS